jgi:hypothetical protein
MIEQHSLCACKGRYRVAMLDRPKALTPRYLLTTMILDGPCLRNNIRYVD